jgi:hypothetical protein
MKSRSDAYQVIKDAREYNAWRRGAETEMPNPKVIGINIELLANMFEALLDAVITTLKNNPDLPELRLLKQYVLLVSPESIREG